MWMILKWLWKIRQQMLRANEVDTRKHTCFLTLSHVWIWWVCDRVILLVTTLFSWHSVWHYGRTTLNVFVIVCRLRQVQQNISRKNPAKSTYCWLNAKLLPPQHTIRHIEVQGPRPHKTEWSRAEHSTPQGQVQVQVRLSRGFSINHTRRMIFSFRSFSVFGFQFSVLIMHLLGSRGTQDKE